MTSDDWLKKQDLSITFLDRYGAEVGRRGIMHDDSVPLDQYPDYVIKAVLATEDRRFFEHFGIDLDRHAARALTVNARSRRRRAGRLVAHPAARQEPVPLQRAHPHAQDQRGLPRALARERLAKREILKLYLDRAYMGGGTFGIQAAAEFYFGKSVQAT